MKAAYSEYPWSVRRNGIECARARTHRESERIIQQLQKIHRSANFDVKYEGKSISHCSEGGKPLV